MIKTALIYFLIDACMERAFIEARLNFLFPERRTLSNRVLRRTLMNKWANGSFTIEKSFDIESMKGINVQDKLMEVLHYEMSIEMNARK